MWSEGNVNSLKVITGSISYPMSIFVTSLGDIYVDNGNSYGQVDKYLFNATNSTSAMAIPTSCYGLFVDINNTLYCSLADLHQIITKSLDDISSPVRIVAGTGCSGSASNMLYNPYGIFVDINFNLHVADRSNHRIQLFRSGELNGTTLAGATASGTISLIWPTSVVLDADSYLFIVDSNNNRIVGSGPTGFRCVVGCSKTYGAASYELNGPRTMAFDSYGNIYVADTSNSRIQKFTLATDSCGMYRFHLLHKVFRQTTITHINSFDYIKTQFSYKSFYCIGLVLPASICEE